MGKYKKYFIPTIFVLPMALHWLLPWGVELKLYISFCGISFFAPDFLYIVYLFNYNRTSTPRRRLSMDRRIALIMICLCVVIYSWLNLVAKDVEYISDLIVNNLSFVWLSLIYLLAPLSSRQVQLTRPVMLSALIILVGEVLLFSLGILHYTTAAGNTLHGQDFGGVMRISTTVSAATGTAIIIGLLGACVVTLYDFSKRNRLLILIITSMGVYFTMSRGSSLAWTLYLVYDFYIHYIKHVSAAKKLRALVGAIIVISIFYGVGGMDPILNRAEHMDRSRDISAGRDSKFQKSLKMIGESAPWGYGLGLVMPEKAIGETHRTPYHFAPHNAYALVAIELGIGGLVLFLIFLAFLMTGISYKSPLAIYLILVWGINANTESTLLDSEWMSLILFAVMSITKYKKPENTTISQNSVYALR